MRVVSKDVVSAGQQVVGFNELQDNSTKRTSVRLISTLLDWEHLIGIFLSYWPVWLQGFENRSCEPVPHWICILHIIKYSLILNLVLIWSDSAFASPARNDYLYFGIICRLFCSIYQLVGLSVINPFSKIRSNCEVWIDSGEERKMISRKEKKYLLFFEFASIPVCIP